MDYHFGNVQSVDRNLRGKITSWYISKPNISPAQALFVLTAQNYVPAKMLLECMWLDSIDIKIDSNNG